MDDFEVIYTEDDIKAVQSKFNELNTQFIHLVQEKKETDVFVSALKDKIRSFEVISKEYQEAQNLLSHFQVIYNELQ